MTDVNVARVRDTIRCDDDEDVKTIPEQLQISLEIVRLILTEDEKYFCEICVLETALKDFLICLLPVESMEK